MDNFFVIVLYVFFVIVYIQVFFVFGIFVYIYIVFVRILMNCLVNVQSIWLRNGIFRVEIVYNVLENYSIINFYEKEYSDFILYFFNEDSEVDYEEETVFLLNMEDKDGYFEEYIGEDETEGILGYYSEEKGIDKFLLVVEKDIYLVGFIEEQVRYNNISQVVKDIFNQIIKSLGLFEVDDKRVSFIDDLQIVVEGNATYSSSEDFYTFEIQVYYFLEIEMLVKVGK